VRGSGSGGGGGRHQIIVTGIPGGSGATEIPLTFTFAIPTLAVAYEIDIPGRPVKRWIEPTVPCCARADLCGLARDAVSWIPCGGGE
jgi:hypothetical protein